MRFQGTIKERKILPDLKVIKKAWLVVDPMLEKDEYGRLQEETIYADTPNGAKKLYSHSSDFIKILAHRYYEEDIVLHNGDELKRTRVTDIARREDRNAKIMALPEDELYVVKNGYVGNAICFWAEHNGGYTCDYDRVRKFKKEEIVNTFINGRDEDVIVYASHLQNKIVKVIDSERGIDWKNFSV